MAGTRTVTRSSQGVRVFSSNSTNSSLTLPTDTTTAPTADNGTSGYVSTGAGQPDGEVHNIAVCEFIGTDAANEQFTVWCFGVFVQDFATTTYHHIPFWKLDVTLGSLVTGASGEYYADTIGVSKDSSGATVQTVETGDFANAAARISWDIQGATMLWFEVDIDELTTNSTNANIVVRFI